MFFYYLYRVIRQQLKKNKMENSENNLTAILNQMEVFTNLNLNTITETMFEGKDYKCFYTIQTSTFTLPSFTALLTIQYKGVNVSQWGATSESDNAHIISFFKNKYATAWKDSDAREKEARAEFKSLINPKLKNVNELTNAELFRQ